MLKKIILVALALFLAVLTVCVVDISIHINRFLDTSNALIVHTDTELNKAVLPQLSKDSTQLVLSIGAIQDDVNKLKPEVDSMLIQTTATLKQTSDSEADIAHSVDMVHQQAGRMIAVSTGIASNIEKATRGMNKEEDAQVQYLADLSKSMIKTTDDLDKIIGDPLLQATIKNTADATKNLATVTGNAAKLSDAYYKKLTAPVTFLKAAVGAVSNFAARVLGSAL